MYTYTDNILMHDRPHCDGSCDGEPLSPTGRIATAVLYCKVRYTVDCIICWYVGHSNLNILVTIQTAPKGGGTSFTKADVFVKPKPLAAAFFSYMGPDGRMDDGYTEHSGCPVLEGEKFIITFWMRQGVSNEKPSDLYDPSGILILDPQA